jgi:hypothetical protein
MKNLRVQAATDFAAWREMRRGAKLRAPKGAEFH